jgi:hypothetical protein
MGLTKLSFAFKYDFIFDYLIHQFDFAVPLKHKN